MSGGADSAAAAFLLKESGYQVAGAFMRLWREKGADDGEKAARAVASALDIPFFLFDLRSEFEQEVVVPFLEAYQSGLTPNPCVDCNHRIKFDLFWRKAEKMGADLMATGHYVRLKKVGGLFELHRGVDREKDQSYFLWRLDQERLERSVFPLGGCRKEDVLGLVEREGLPVRPGESMEVCFIASSIGEFLSQRLEFSPGPILDDSGREVGCHRGLPLYTIGQRRGIGLPGGPYYVRNKDIVRNTLIVASDKRTLNQRVVGCAQLNWLDGFQPECPIAVKAKIRYRQIMSEAVLDFERGVFRAEFKKEQRAVTPGQSIVFYRGTKLLGGGVILDDFGASSDKDISA